MKVVRAQPLYLRTYSLMVQSISNDVRKINEGESLSLNFFLTPDLQTTGVRHSTALETQG